MAISPLFERLILQGKAEHKIWNISEAVNNYNSGRGSNFVVESIRINPFILSSFINTQSLSISNFNYIKENTVFTLNVYNNDNIKSFSFKNTFDMNAIYRDSADRTTSYPTSKMNIEKNVFWFFKGESITAEILGIQDLDVINEVLGDSKAAKNKRFNPQGFEDPVVNQKQYGSIATTRINPLGRKTSLPGGSIQYNEFVIPATGGITAVDYNGVRVPTPATPPELNENILPLINIGIIEFSDTVKNQVCSKE